MVSRTLPSSSGLGTAPFRPPQAASLRSDVDNSGILRRMGFRCALFLVFLRFGYVHEVLAHLLGNTDTYILFTTNTLAIAAALATGSLRRTFSAKQARWWLVFLVWLLLATVFSSWKGESSTLWLGFLRNDFALLFIVAGLTLTLKECRQMAYAVALGGLVNVVVGKMLFHSIENGRLFIDFGSISNSNDFAAHLLLVLPFVVFAVLTKAKPIKAIGIVVVMVGTYLAADTASRGALVSAVIVGAFVVIRSRGFVRVAALIALPVTALLLIAILPDAIKSRYATLVDEQAAQADTSATESLEARQELLQSSLQLTMKNPLWGVGPGEFANNEGGDAKAQGRHGHWQVSHNSYTQVSSEAGIPALIFFLGAIVSTFRLISSVEKRCRNLPQFRAAAQLAFCMMMSLVGFGFAIVFLSLAYSFYLPFLTGLAIALNRAVQKELSQAAPPRQPGRPLSSALPQFPAYQKI